MYLIGLWFSGASVDIWLQYLVVLPHKPNNKNNNKLTNNNKFKLIKENKAQKNRKHLGCTPECNVPKAATEGAALTSAVVVHNCDCFPLEKLHQIQDGSAKGREVWVETDVEGILVVGHLVLPAGLYVRNPQGITDGLDCIGWWAVWRPKDSSHPKWQLITSWRGERSLLTRRGKEGVNRY